MTVTMINHLFLLVQLVNLWVERHVQLGRNPPEISLTGKTLDKERSWQGMMMGNQMSSLGYQL